VTALPVLWLLWYGGWFGLGAAGLLITLPIAGYSAGILKPPKPRPMYSRALARMKFGKYSEAEWEIIRQLENAQSDFNGWLMLADLYASQFKDLAEAEQIILEICDQPEATPSQIAVALHKLADWQLAVANDPEAAARALQVISLRLPNTHLARMAEMRRAQLPGSSRELQAQRQPRPIPLPALSDPLSTPPPLATGAMSPAQALEAVNRLSEQLTQNPDCVADRDALARLLADPLGKADLAIEQIELLVAMPNGSDAQRAEWLALMAMWQLQLQQDEAAASKTLERIVQEFPNCPQAFAAQRRRSLLRAEAAARKAR
jgi:tetratricopeptide (TPR) repeat protein